MKTTFYEGDIAEHMWVGDLRWDGERFVGTLGNTPVDVHDLAFGQEVTVERGTWRTGSTRTAKRWSAATPSRC